MKNAYMYRNNGKMNKFIVGEHYCDICASDMLPFGNWMIDFNKRLGRREWLICDKCLKSDTFQIKLGIIPNEFGMQIHQVFFVESEKLLPPGSVPYIAEYHGWSDAKVMSTFQAADNKLAPAEIVIDNTKLAGKESFEGAQIGMRVQDAIEDHDRIIRNDDDACAFLFDLREGAEKALEEEKRTMIDDKRGEEE